MLKIVRTPAEQAHYVQSRMYDISQTKDRSKWKAAFEKLMVDADVTPSIRRELWNVMLIGPTKPRAVVKRNG